MARPFTDQIVRQQEPLLEATILLVPLQNESLFLGILRLWDGHRQTHYCLEALRRRCRTCWLGRDARPFCSSSSTQEAAELAMQISLDSQLLTALNVMEHFGRSLAPEAKSVD